MPNEIPQELLDEMIHMNNEQFDFIEKRWRDNLFAKSTYEKQYYDQLQGYLDYNKTFKDLKDSQRPLKPHEHNALTDQELLKEAQAINLDNARQKARQEAIQQQQQQRAEIVKSFIGEKEQIMKVEKAPEQIRFENPAPPHISKEIKEITAKLFDAMKYEALELEHETRLNYPANDLRPSDREIELER